MHPNTGVSGAHESAIRSSRLKVCDSDPPIQTASLVNRFTIRVHLKKALLRLGFLHCPDYSLCYGIVELPLVLRHDERLRQLQDVFLGHVDGGVHSLLVGGRLGLGAE